jgi:hypothetical protein
VPLRTRMGRGASGSAGRQTGGQIDRRRPEAGVAPHIPCRAYRCPRPGLESDASAVCQWRAEGGAAYLSTGPDTVAGRSASDASDSLLHRLRGAVLAAGRRIDHGRSCGRAGGEPIRSRHQAARPRPPRALALLPRRRPLPLGPAMAAVCRRPNRRKLHRCPPTPHVHAVAHLRIDRPPGTC